MSESEDVYPDWCAPYTAMWDDVHRRWMVLFPDERSAKRGLLAMSLPKGTPPLVACEAIGMWFVAVL